MWGFWEGKKMCIKKFRFSLLRETFQLVPLNYDVYLYLLGLEIASTLFLSVLFGLHSVVWHISISQITHSFTSWMNGVFLWLVLFSHCPRISLCTCWRKKSYQPLQTIMHCIFIVMYSMWGNRQRNRVECRVLASIDISECLTCVCMPDISCQVSFRLVVCSCLFIFLRDRLDKVKL